MPARKDHIAWSPQEIAKLRYLSETMGLGSRQAARRLNDEMHGGETVRTETMVNLARSRNGILVGKRGKGAAPNTTEQPIQSVDITQSGDELTVITNGLEVRTLDELVARAKVDLSVWEVDKPQTRMWEVKVKDAAGKIRNAQNFYIACSFKRKHGPNVKEQVEALIAGAFATNKKASRPIPPLRDKKVDAGLMQAVVIADPHLAKYAWNGETGWGDYDLSTGCRLVSHAGHELMDWGDSHKPAERHLWLMGDVMQYDNPQGTTTGGTPQDRDTRLAKMLEESASVICRLIERSADTCKTKVICVAGNHDRGLTIALQLILAAHFRHDKRVEVDTSATMRKYVEWGDCLIGLTHGDTARKRLPALMTTERREAWGRARVREWHHGHFHSEANTTTEGGITIRQHLALCPPDGWHTAEGYVGAPRGMDSYLYRKEGKVQGWWRSTVLDG